VNIEDYGCINNLIAFLDYGTIEVVGSTDLDRILFKQASNPAKIQRSINKFILQKMNGGIENNGEL